MKFSKKVFEQIFEMQNELNCLVGVDTLAISKRSLKKRDMWIDRYMVEAHLEIAECMENFHHKWWSKDVKENPKLLGTVNNLAKVKLELIDALHFCMSALIVEFGSSEYAIEEVEGNRKLYKDVKPKLGNVFSSLNYILGTNFSGVFFVQLERIMHMLKMKEKEILDIYIMKWKANKLRQQNGYSVATKNEKDNEAIEKAIRISNTKRNLHKSFFP